MCFMTIKKGYILKEVAGCFVVVDTTGCLDFNGIIKLNETAVVLWQVLEKGAEMRQLTEALVSEYEIDYTEAEKDALSFVDSLKEAGVIE